MTLALVTDTQRAQRLIEGWRATSNRGVDLPVAAARRLVAGFRALRASRAPPGSPPPRINAPTIRRFLDGLRGPVERARARGEFMDLWAIAGLGRREVPNAAVLAWMISPQGSHGQGPLCLAALMDLVACKAPEWTVEADRLSSARVEAEQRPLGSDRDRVDIVIEAPGLIVFIEIKIDAGEGEAQLSRYTESAHRVAAVRTAPGASPVTPLVLFLSPRPPAESVPNVVHLTWRDVAVALTVAARDAPDPARFIIRSFAQHARSFG